jgi:hypothetical protein
MHAAVSSKRDAPREERERGWAHEKAEHNKDLVVSQSQQLEHAQAGHRVWQGGELVRVQPQLLQTHAHADGAWQSQDAISLEILPVPESDEMQGLALREEVLSTGTQQGGERRRRYQLRERAHCSDGEGHVDDLVVG